MRVLIPSYAVRADGSIATIALVIGSKVPLWSSRSVSILEIVELYISLRFAIAPCGVVTLLESGVGETSAGIGEGPRGEGCSDWFRERGVGLLLKKAFLIFSKFSTSLGVGVRGFSTPSFLSLPGGLPSPLVGLVPLWRSLL